MGQGSVVLLDKPFMASRKFDPVMLAKLEKLPGYQGLKPRAQEFLYWVNTMRSNPKAFQDQYIIGFLNQFPEADAPEAKDLMADLRKAGQLPLLSISSVLSNTAQQHNDFLVQKGRISHAGKGGKDFGQRMREANVQYCAGENIFDGQDDALVGLILLLIDRGVPGAGHRQALLNPQFQETGIGVGYTDQGRMFLVQQFSCKQ